MILTCEECKTRYLVPGHAVGPEGRRVRCTNCGHEWFQEPEDDAPPEMEPEDLEPIPEAVRPMPEGSEVPVIAAEPMEERTFDKARLFGYAAAAALLLVVLGGFFLARDQIAKAWPASLILYDLAGIETGIDGENLIFDQLKAFAEVNEEGIQILTVEANILNLSREESTVPYIQVTILDEAGAPVDSWLVEPEADVLEKQGELPFKTTYPEVSSDVKEVNVRFIAGKELQVFEAEKTEDGGEGTALPADH